MNEKEALGGFIQVDKCFDSSEKAFQKKVLCIKVSQRYYTQTAVSDIIILIKNKRPPGGYSYIGEINGQSICIKFSQIPKNSPSSANLNKQAVPPPIPPRPFTSQAFGQDTLVENNFVHVSWPTPEFNSAKQTNEVIDTNQYIQSNNNPLHGVPFEINPIYHSLKSNVSSSQILVKNFF